MGLEVDGRARDLDGVSSSLDFETETRLHPQLQQLRSQCMQPHRAERAELAGAHVQWLVASYRKTSQDIRVREPGTCPRVL